MSRIPSPAASGTAARGGALSLSGVSKTHRLADGDLEVLRAVNLSVAPGEFVAVVGASGCGKSTLLRLIAGLDNDYAGEIRLDDARILSPSLDRGIVFQDHRLFPWMTVEQNVAVALVKRRLNRGAKRKLVAENLALVGLTGFERAYPHQLSGGMAQRAAIARALVNEPKVLLLDEPFGALDALTRLKLQEELLALRQRTNATVVLVTHDVEEALFLSDRVVVLQPRPGRVAEIISVGEAARDRASPVFARLREQILSGLTAAPATAASPIDLTRRRLDLRQAGAGS
ncbi:ABC transporter ATP-binding protein [Phenylobacterium sp. LjRoot219]|uniref:ABC transporter ATP-binding protein n=1 Tax=Phenylobacterium sp. LjRoot219 TaxID=3342283 RepID=UPI003ED14489